MSASIIMQANQEQVDIRDGSGTAGSCLGRAEDEAQSPAASIAGAKRRWLLSGSGVVIWVVRLASI